MFVKQVRMDIFKFFYRTGIRLNKTRILIAPSLFELNIAYIDIDVVVNVKRINHNKLNKKQDKDV